MPETNKAGVIKLTTEDKKKMESLQTEIDRAETAVKALKTLDIDTKDIEEKIGWAKKAREVLLTEFV